MADTLNINPKRASRVGDNALTTLIRRLEAATSRLEDIATSATSIEDKQPNGIPSAPQGGIPASNSAPELPGLARDASAGGAGSAAPSLPASITDMDQLIKTDLETYTEAGKDLDPTISEQVRTTSSGSREGHD